MGSKRKRDKCPVWSTRKINYCPLCFHRSYVLVCKHEEYGDYICGVCNKDCDWFWYCRRKCGIGVDDEVNGGDID